MRLRPNINHQITKTLTSILITAAIFLVLAITLPHGLPLGVIFFGIVQGGLYALTAVGLVLLYRSQKIVNFSQAAIGSVAASVTIVSVSEYHVNYWIGIMLGLITGLVVSALVEVSIIRRFSDSPRLILTVATLGIAQLLGGIALAIPAIAHFNSLNTFASPFSFKFTISPIQFTGDHVVAIIAVTLGAVGLWYFLDKTDTGIAIRASADSRERSMLLGIPVRRLSLITWVVAGFLAALGAILSSPASLGNPPDLSVVAGPLALLPPLAAAIVGKMENLARTFYASLMLGIFQQAAFWSYPKSSIVDVGFFLVVLVSLIVQPPESKRGDIVTTSSFISVEEVSKIDESLKRVPIVKLVRYGLPALLLILAFFTPQGLSNSNILPLCYIAIYAIIAVSLVVLTGWAGQVSLGQFAFAGIGAAITASLLVHAHMDLFLALLISAIVAAVVAVIIGIPALRISGIFLAVVTLAFAVPVSTYLLNSTYFPTLDPPTLAPPSLFGKFSTGNLLVLYRLCLICLVVFLILARNLRASRFGRATVAVRENEAAAQSYGVSVFRIKLAVFAIAGAMAGLAGGLFVVLQQGLSFAGFDPNLSISVFTMVVIGGLGSLSGAVLGAVYVGFVSYDLHGYLSLFATGIGLLLLLWLLPNGLGGVLYKLRDAFYNKVADALQLRKDHLRVAYNVEHPAIANNFQHSDLNKTLKPVLVGEGLAFSYKHVQVLFDVNVSLDKGGALAILGTNGAGKSTLIRVLSGLEKPSKGTIVLEGRDISKLSPEERVSAGLVTVPGGRGVFPSLTVRENLRISSWTTKTDREYVAKTYKRIYELFPVLAERLHSKAWMLSGGEQQMLAIAQALLCRPKVLMIDELSLGLAPIVVAGLIEVLKSLVDAGVTLLIVEQSLNVASAISPQALFIERGEIRFEGSMEELMEHEHLIRSIFIGGSGSSEIVPSGTTHEDFQHLQPLFKAFSVSKRFGGIAAVEDVTLDIKPGEIHGIIGANGAGKTSFFDLCSGFQKPDHGAIYFDNEDITRHSPDMRSLLGIGRLFQHATLFPALSVLEALELAHERFIFLKDPISAMFKLPEARRSEAAARKRAEELIEQFDLGKYASMQISDISTGTRRIVELACALAHRPKLLLLDEPSSGLAQRESESLAELLYDIRQKTGAALLVIEHDVPLISSIADRLTCLHLGSVIASGDPKDVLSDPMVIASYLGTDERAIFRSDTKRLTVK